MISVSESVYRIRQHYDIIEPVLSVQEKKRRSMLRRFKIIKKESVVALYTLLTLL